MRHGLLLFLLLVASASAVEPESPRIAIVMSEETAQFTEALDGLKGALASRQPTARITIHRPGQGRPRLDPAPELTIGLGSAALDAPLPKGPPIVACMLLDPPPVGAGIAGAIVLDHPPGTQARTIRLALPRARNLGVVYRERDRERVRAFTAAAEREGLSVVAQVVETPAHLPGALDRLMDRIDALWLPPDPVLYNAQTAKGLLLFSFRQRIPIIGLSDAWVRAGALLALERDYGDIGRQCGELAGDILQKAARPVPAAAPPRRVIHVVNQRTARHMRVDNIAGALPGPVRVHE